MRTNKASTRKEVIFDFQNIISNSRFSRYKNLTERLEEIARRAHNADFSTDIDPSYEDYLELYPLVEEILNTQNGRGTETAVILLECIYANAEGTYTKENVFSALKKFNLNIPNSSPLKSIQRRTEYPFDLINTQSPNLS